MTKRLREAIKLTAISLLLLFITTFIIFGEPIWPGIFGGMIVVFIMSYYFSPKKHQKNI
jgi:uncharacterized membrane protein